MDTLYYVILAILFFTALLDLIVGVSNDAINFLSSAVGSKAASYKTLMVIAGFGIIIGTTFSQGMMEVARKGIFNPQMFTFHEIMIIFLAVMLTDVILLDLFNTFGLPTSTTVSLIFDLLGASVAIAFLKVYNNGQDLSVIASFINSAKALAIISGILISIVVAFSAGMIVQYVTRLIFTFNYERSYIYFGSIFGGFGITSIIYFLLIKGVEGSSLVNESQTQWIHANTFTIILYSFIGSTILLEILRWIFKINILKMVVLFGTFALAMAFAGNDLVNFIGVPLAGMASYKAFAAVPLADPTVFKMTSLAAKVQTPTYILVGSGIIMFLSMWLSRKARSVTLTGINLSKQDEGEERFSSSNIAKIIVRIGLVLGYIFSIFVPLRIRKIIDKRFDTKVRKSREKTHFDLVRASVNLIVSSILIATATSYKLPLSTTYVTFMVAMGTSFADRAWDRESAVYRVSGVATVIGGWFFTAISAFTVAFIITMVIWHGKLPAIAALIVFELTILYMAYKLYKHREDNFSSDINTENTIGDKSIIEKCKYNVVYTLTQITTLYHDSLDGLITESRHKLRKTRNSIRRLNEQTKQWKNNLHRTIHELEDDIMDSGHYYIQLLDYLRASSHCLSHVCDPILEHVDNHHKPLIDKQVTDLRELDKTMHEIFFEAILIHKENRFTQLDLLTAKQHEIMNLISKMKKKQLKMIKKNEVGTRNTMLYLNLLVESKNLVLHLINLIKAERDFIAHSKKAE